LVSTEINFFKAIEAFNKTIMKKILLFSMFALFITSVDAQIDLKINPLGILFSSPDLSGEYAISEDIGVELSVGVIYGSVLGSGLLDEAGRLDKSGYRIRLTGKYYFNPNRGIDKFFAGVYLGPKSNKFSGNEDFYGFDPGYKRTGFTIGLLAGYKVVSDKGFLFEASFGLGRTLGGEITYNDADLNTIDQEGFGIDGVATLAVGYRIGSSR